MLFLTSCLTTANMNYSDPNYLGSDEFSTYDEITANNQIDRQEIASDTNNTINNYYETDDYYDYSFSSRIRRFHRPMYGSSYYGGIYTDYYWYNNDPLYCGTSIYYGYNWNSPYYYDYSYSPYYYDYYYTPYYTGIYYGHYGYYGYRPYQHYNHNLNAHSNKHYTYGHRSTLSTKENRGVKSNAINTNTTVVRIKDNTPFRGNTYNKKNKGITKNTYKNKNYENKSSTRTKKNINHSNSKTNRSNNNSNKTYYSPRSNTRNYKSNSGNRSNSSKRSSSNRRGTKPRR
ncbi:MAG: hypothetical protein CMD16_04390 [Flavobacteriales bacterium]|nr:hypothetical protein [Flavobacteriales bacterium]|tara:strand:+ start:2394 stop:3254 length:861 start_codon:yes stop_codon:yes gene_type:complete